MSHPPQRVRRITVGAAVLVALVVGPASAHLEVSPGSVLSGSTVKVTFTVEHGCAGSPTKKVAIKLPAGVVVTTPAGPSGWFGTVSGQVLTFDGGTLGAKTPGKFTAVITFPKAKGLLTFPAVQTCIRGVNNWIAIPTKADPSPAEPAPQIGVGVKRATPA